MSSITSEATKKKIFSTSSLFLLRCDELLIPTFIFLSIAIFFSEINAESILSIAFITKINNLVIINFFHIAIICINISLMIS